MKILIVDDHAVVREGCRRLLSTLNNAQILEASNHHEAMKAFRAEAPDVVVLDIDLGDSSGLELLKRLRMEPTPARVVMFTMHADGNYARRAMAGGALGFVGKSAPADDLIVAVRCAAAGQRFTDKDVAEHLAQMPSPADDPLSGLSNRETEILRLLGDGKSLAEIAQTFGIAYKTVANSCSRLKEKLGIERTADLIRISIESRGR